MQILINLILYGFLAFLIYESVYVAQDYFMTFCVCVRHFRGAHHQVHAQSSCGEVHPR